MSHSIETLVGEESSTLGWILLLTFIVLICYLFAGQFFEEKHIHLIHETGIGMIFGLIIGGILYFCYYDSYNEDFTFNGTLFIYAILPPIIFSEGYNLKKRRLFQNFAYIILYGVLGSILTFFLIYVFTILVNKYDLIYDSKHDEVIKLTTEQMLLYSAALTTKDSLQSIVTLSPDDYPKLFSITFGEGIVNESVTLALFQSAKDVISTQESFGWLSALQIIGQFLLVWVGSSFFGILFACISTLSLKYLKFLGNNAIVETALIFFFEYVTYITTEMLELSSIFAVLVCGIMMSHYQFYNLSVVGQVTSVVFLQTISLILEGFLYVYMGAQLWQCFGTAHSSQKNSVKHEEVQYFSWGFTGLELLIITVSRFLSIIIVTLIYGLIRGVKKLRVNRYEVLMISMAGIFRGAVAYSQISSIEDEEHPEGISIMKGTMSVIILFTNLIYGAMFPYIVHWSFRQIKKMGDVESIEDSSSKEHLLSEKHKKQSYTMRESAQITESEQSKQFKGKTQKFWSKIDENIFKPILIRDYQKRKEDIQEQKDVVKVNNSKFAGSLKLAYQLIRRQSILNYNAALSRIDVGEYIKQQRKTQGRSFITEEEEKNIATHGHSGYLTSHITPFNQSKSDNLTQKQVLSSDSLKKLIAPIPEVEEQEQDNIFASNNDQRIQSHAYEEQKQSNDNVITISSSLNDNSPNNQNGDGNNNNTQNNTGNKDYELSDSVNQNLFISKVQSKIQDPDDKKNE